MTGTSETLARQVRAWCQKWDMLEGTVLCAVSGGRDSMARLHLLSAMAEEGGFQVAAAHFNHQLRPAADRDEAFVRDWCREREIPFTCGRGDVRELAREKGASIEDAARTLRYAFLEEAAGNLGAARIATAHHREDNAETVLLHLLHGTGLQGLGGIPPVRGKIVRPLLETSRADIDAYVAENAVPYVEDESNSDTAYTRNRLRLEALPLLEEIAPGCGARIAAAAALLRAENEHIQREAEGLLPAPKRDIITLPVTVLLAQDQVLRRRLVRAMGREMGVSLTQKQTEAVLALGSGRFLYLPGGVCAVRQSHQLILKKQPPQLEPLALQPGEQDWGPWRVTVEQGEGPAEETPDRVVLRDTGQTLTIAHWDGTGRLTVENGKRGIKRLFADKGIPVEKRAEHPAVLLSGKAAAIFGVATDWTYRPCGDRPWVAVTLRWLDEEEQER